MTFACSSVKVALIGSLIISSCVSSFTSLGVSFFTSLVVLFSFVAHAAKPMTIASASKRLSNFHPVFCFTAMTSSVCGDEFIIHFFSCPSQEVYQNVNKRFHHSEAGPFSQSGSGYGQFYHRSAAFSGQDRHLSATHQFQPLPYIGQSNVWPVIVGRFKTRSVI